MISLNGVRCIFRIRYIRAHKLNCSQFWKSLFFSFLFYFFIDMDFFCPPFHRSWLLAFVADVDIFFCFRLEFERKTGEAEKKHKMKNGKRAVAITTHNENENRNNTQVWKRLRHNRVRMFCVCAHFNTCNSRNRSLNRFARHAIAWHGNGYVCIWYVGCLKAPSSNKTTAITRTLQPVRTAQPNIFRFLPFLFFSSVLLYLHVCKAI